MTVEELLIALEGYNDDILVVCAGRRIDKAIYLSECPPEPEVIELTLKPIN